MQVAASWSASTPADCHSPMTWSKSLVKKTKGASAAFIKELMRRAAQFNLQDGNRGRLTANEFNLALEEMLFTGGSLNAKLLGASGVSRETIGQ